MTLSLRAKRPDPSTPHRAPLARLRPQSEPAWTVQRGGVRDVSAMLNLVVAAAAEGHFTRSYLDIRYQLGLALQLFSAVLLRRVSVTGQPATRAAVTVVRQDGDVLGFALVRNLACPGATHRELHLLAVRPDARQRGVGRALLHDAVGALGEDQALFLATLPGAHGMKRLVRRSGWRSLGPVCQRPQQRQVPEAHVWGPGPLTELSSLPWRGWLGGDA